MKILELTKREKLFLAKHELTQEYHKIMEKSSCLNLPPEVRKNMRETSLELHDIVMLYFREHRVKKSSQVIAELKTENVKLREGVKCLRKVANSAAEWIVNAKIAVEPGWEGSQSHILRDLEEQIKQTDFYA